MWLKMLLKFGRPKCVTAFRPVNKDLRNKVLCHPASRFDYYSDKWLHWPRAQATWSSKSQRATKRIQISKWGQVYCSFSDLCLTSLLLWVNSLKICDCKKPCNFRYQNIKTKALSVDQCVKCVSNVELPGKLSLNHLFSVTRFRSVPNPFIPEVDICPL